MLFEKGWRDQFTLCCNSFDQIFHLTCSGWPGTNLFAVNFQHLTGSVHFMLQFIWPNISFDLFRLTWDKSVCCQFSTSNRISSPHVAILFFNQIFLSRSQIMWWHAWNSTSQQCTEHPIPTGPFTCYVKAYILWANEGSKLYIQSNCNQRQENGPSITLSQTSPYYLCICSTSLLKTLREKEEKLLTSNFSSSPSVFYPFWRTFCHIHQISSSCHLQTLSIRKSLTFVGNKVQESYHNFTLAKF